MSEHHLLIFGLIGALGLAIIILGFKFSEKTKKVIETTGAIIFHVGVFGILYHKVSLNLFISLVALVFSLFILIDPLKIANHVNAKIYRLLGYITLFAAVAFSLDYFSGFPVWLWTIPLIIYLSPYLVSPLRKHLKLVLALSWLVVFSYVGLIGYVIYSKYNPEADVSLVQKIFPQLKIPSPTGKIYKAEDFAYNPDEPQDKTLTPKQVIKKELKKLKPKDNVISPPQPKEETIAKTDSSPKESTNKPTVSLSVTPPPSNKTLSGPYLKSLQEADLEFVELKKKHKTLQEKYEALQKENEGLKEKVELLKKQSKTANQETL